MKKIFVSFIFFVLLSVGLGFVYHGNFQQYADSGTQCSSFGGTCYGSCPSGFSTHAGICSSGQVCCTPATTPATSCTVTTYTECEYGNSTFCFDSGQVKQGDLAQVTQNTDCSYSCQDLGLCSSGTPGSVSGHVKDTAGNPIAGVIVNVYDNTKNQTQPSTTDPTGYWHVDNFLTSGGKFNVRAPQIASNTSPCPLGFLCNASTSPKATGPDGYPSTNPQSYESMIEGSKSCTTSCDFVYTPAPGTTPGITPGATITPPAGTSIFTPISGKWISGAPVGIGVITNGLFYLHNNAMTGFTNELFAYGLATDKYVSCDWNGTGIKTPGVFQNGTWFIRNTNSTGNADIVFAYGTTGDIPVCGDWTGQGKQTIGVFRNGIWLLRNSNSAGNPDIDVAYGAAGDIPIVGKWVKGATRDTIGIIRGNTWYLRTTTSTGNPSLSFTYGALTDKFTVGDWTGQGFDTPAAVRDNGKTWLLRFTNTAGNADRTVIFDYTRPTFSLTLVAGLQDIGFNGPVGVAPLHLARPVTIELYGPAVTNPGGPGTHPLSTTNGVLTYASNGNNAGYFIAPITIPLPTTPTANNQYQLLVKMPQYLYQLATNPTSTDSSATHVFTITAGASIAPSPLILFPGDVAITNGGLNHLNLDDYTVMLSCYGANATSASCPVKPAAGALGLTDLNDDGHVDTIDLNIWIRSLFQLQQAQAPGCSVGDCQGD